MGSRAEAALARAKGTFAFFPPRFPLVLFVLGLLRGEYSSAGPVFVGGGSSSCSFLGPFPVVGV